MLATIVFHPFLVRDINLVDEIMATQPPALATS